jgi:very-short-patch-repair endonuclease
MPPLLTLVELREAIADVIADNEKAYDVPTICTALGLASGDSNEAFSSKRVYVRSRIITKSIGELVDLGEKLLERYPDADDLENMIGLFKTTGRGVTGHIKNLIFAADGPKPELVLSDALNNTIEIVENSEYCLVYDLPISSTGLFWKHLVEWWSNKNNLPFPDKQTEYDLFYRLIKSLASPPEKLLFETYFKYFHPKLGGELPALIPQVYLHYDPKTLKELKGEKRLSRQRMDFLLIFSNNERVVIEVDGKQHYSEGDLASPQKYIEMVAEDRKLRLLGYEVYRFSGYELVNEAGKEKVQKFFNKLLSKHHIHCDHLSL